MLIKQPLPKTHRFRAWEEFIATGAVTSSHKSHIRESWKRCMDSSLDPRTDNLSRCVSQEEKTRLLDKHAMLLDASRPNLAILEKSMARMDYALLLCESEGDILYQSGSGRVARSFESANLVVGGTCREDVIGTTAPGIVLVEKKPRIVLREEHFSEIYHWCCCAAYPIFDIDGQLAGCLDFTVLDEQAENMNFLFGLNMATVKSIESALHIQQLLKRMDEAREFVEGTSDLTRNSLLILDRGGRILHANQKAADLLGTPVHRLNGQPFTSVLESDAVRVCLGQRKRVQGKAESRGRNGPAERFDVQARPLINRQGRFIGAVLLLEKKPASTALRAPGAGPGSRPTFRALIGRSPRIRRALDLASRFAETDVPILLQGDTGTGKEMFAQAIHCASRRKEGPFVPVNCAAIPRDLVESELFGYRHGAFTGALREGKKGKFELAGGGTLFLDEINSMPIDLQGKLLRAVENGEIVPLGDHEYKHVDVRLVAASSLPLEQEIENGGFRKDLFYRLSLVRISLPPLRERVEDLVPLVDNLLARAAFRLGKHDLKLHPTVLAILLAHSWPGNIRELENCIEFAVHLAESHEILPEHLPDYLRGEKGEGGKERGPATQDLVDRSTIQRALESTGGRIGEAARRLGISRSTLYRKMRRHGIGKRPGGQTTAAN